jgi:hypothetical protein
VTGNDPTLAFRAVILALCLAGISSGGEGRFLSTTMRERDDVFLVLRETPAGCAAAIFSPLPLVRGASSRGMERAVLRAFGSLPGSAAVFAWQRQDQARDWLRRQADLRRQSGLPVRLILAGHGLGGAAAAETARFILDREPDSELVLLLTVDAVKTGRLERVAGAAGSAIAGSLPGVSANFVAYDAAPVPDGRRFWFHVNYYQDRTPLCRGAPLPGAENHLIHDETNLLVHENAEDFVFPFLVADFRAALERGTP